MAKNMRRNLILIALVAFLSTGSYILGSYLYYRIGYPLDDAWIYQTYARNLIQRGEWAFIPGAESGGSTGPLWVLLLTPGYFLRLDHHLWTYLLGSTILMGIGMLGIWGFKLIQPDYKKWALAGGLILVLEWHLIWAAVSGMETLLFAFAILLTLVWLLKPGITPQAYFLIGILIGISVWIRPDGITLLGPAGFIILANSKGSGKKIIQHGLLLACGFLIPFGLYLVFNQFTAGTLWPNTFYAKQAEYAELREAGIISRLSEQFMAVLPGVGIALAPGFIITLYQALKKRNWAVIASSLWFVGYLSIYAFRLPVTYQHGRYIIPAMPVFFILGAASAIPWIIEHFTDKNLLFRVIAKVWLISGLSILGLFWILGVKAYAEDTALIESEMVASAYWIRENTATHALIAAHDIGALGYFAQRDIVDLAGLISPDVIPFIRDETRLAEYLTLQQAEYLMTFPKWYPSLVSQADLIFETHGVYSPQQGGENMAVYRWIIAPQK